MANTGDKVNWSDITTLFTNLNTARKKFSFSEVTPSGGEVGVKCETTPLSTMKTFMSDMKSNRFLKDVDLSSLTIPDVGDLIKAAFISSWQGVITTITNICPHDSNHFSGFNGSSFDAGHISSFDGSSFKGSNFDAANVSSFFTSGNNTSNVSGFLSAGDNSSHISNFQGSSFNSSHNSGFFTNHNAFFQSAGDFESFDFAENWKHFGGFLMDEVG